MIHNIVYNINCGTSDCNSSAVVDLLFSQMTGSAPNNCGQSQNNPFFWSYAKALHENEKNVAKAEHY